MRSHADVRQAIAILGSSFADPDLRRFIWGSFAGEAGRAMAMFQTLAWVEGVESDFATVLEYVTLKLHEFADRKQEEKINAH